jgi:hypothetical protein
MKASMEREEMWVEELEWIEADDAVEETLRGVLVVFDEYGKPLTFRAEEVASGAPAGRPT